MVKDKIKSKKLEDEKIQDFKIGYEKLCNETGYNLVGNPAFAKTNHESYEMVIQFSIGKIGK